MFYAYFDEGGHPSNSKVVSIACVVAPVKSWHKFSDKWERILRRYKIANGLHMTDFENRKGDFRDWKRNDPRAIPFITQLSSIMLNQIQFGYVASLIMEDWNEVMNEWDGAMKKKFIDGFFRKRSSFLFLFQACLEFIQETPLIPSHEKVAFMFEETKFLTGAVPESFIKCKDEWGLGEKWGNISFGKKYHYRPLEGADLLAYEGPKHVLNQLVNGGRVAERKLHRYLGATNKIKSVFYNEQAIRAYMKANIITAIKRN